MIMKNLIRIKNLPTTYIDKEDSKCHESILKAYNILNLVKQMLDRGDSTETIKMVVSFLEGKQDGAVLGGATPNICQGVIPKD